MTTPLQVAVFLLAIVLAVPIFRWLKLGAVLGYIVAGVALGPWGLGLVTEVDAVAHIAEFGVVLLLFVIGLELQPSRLWALRRTVFGLGSAQVVATTLVLAALLALYLPVLSAAVIGFALALSSTALVLQVLAERAELTQKHGRAAFGILLFQDVAATPVLALLPALAAGAGDATSPWKLLVALAGALGALWLGRRLLTPALRLVARSHSREAFTAAALLVVVGTALAASAGGLSMALGAFLAGVLLADSEYRHELEADIEPFKGLLLGLFFISVGLAANLGLLLERPLLVLSLVTAMLALKGLAALLVGRLGGLDARQSVALAAALAGGGEFAFVLLAVAARNRLIDPATADLTVLVVALSMAVTPLVMLLASRLTPRGQAEQRPFDAIEPTEPQVVIAGFGRYGQIVGRILRARRIAFTALEASPAQVDFVRRFGNLLYYGDATRPELLESARVGQARVLVVAVDDVEASVRIVELARRHYPQVRVFARARNRAHAFRLMDLGAHHVMRETLLSSLETAEHVLEALGIGAAEARTTVRTFRTHDERVLARQSEHRGDEAKLVQTSQEAARELERLFESDQPGTPPAGS